ncbi:hypothetical protein M0R88_03625 [Halorussus gelatinilyticus]|uniref:Uncharacterized protein n=1 Tax=Halorussus gelatinilyticus TaxID=2937524 RepID=A0A8U0IJB5_9EURY|nr:hypothetical protein [Halorussus gelatinilyticus]UPW01200.1 hypothetical protein M0R88_03625 [Halorussus gelatinilyticus]
MRTVNASGPTVALSGLGGCLTALAIVNYASGVYGGATVAGIGGIVAFAFVLLVE